MGLGIEDVRTAIATATSNQPKGGVGATQRLAIGVDDQLLDAERGGKRDRRAPRPPTVRLGGAARLGDIATVTDDVENQRVAGWFDGERTVLVIIRRQPGANILEVIDRIKALMPELAALDPAGIDMTIAHRSLGHDPRVGPRRRDARS